MVALACGSVFLSFDLYYTPQHPLIWTHLYKRRRNHRRPVRHTSHSALHCSHSELPLRCPGRLGWIQWPARCSFNSQSRDPQPGGRDSAPAWTGGCAVSRVWISIRFVSCTCSYIHRQWHECQDCNCQAIKAKWVAQVEPSSRATGTVGVLKVFGRTCVSVCSMMLLIMMVSGLGNWTATSAINAQLKSFL